MIFNRKLKIHYAKLWFHEIIHNLTQISWAPFINLDYFVLLNIPLQGTITYNQYDW